jgi:hypothetical protein
VGARPPRGRFELAGDVQASVRPVSRPNGSGRCPVNPDQKHRRRRRPVDALPSPRSADGHPENASRAPARRWMKGPKGQAPGRSQLRSRIHRTDPGPPDAGGQDERHIDGEPPAATTSVQTQPIAAGGGSRWRPPMTWRRCIRYLGGRRVVLVVGILALLNVAGVAWIVNARRMSSEYVVATPLPAPNPVVGAPVAPTPTPPAPMQAPAAARAPTPRATPRPPRAPAASASPAPSPSATGRQASPSPGTSPTPLASPTRTPLLRLPQLLSGQLPPGRAAG